MAAISQALYRHSFIELSKLHFEWRPSSTTVDKEAGAEEGSYLAQAFNFAEEPEGNLAFTPSSCLPSLCRDTVSTKHCLQLAFISLCEDQDKNGWPGNPILVQFSHHGKDHGLKRWIPRHTLLVPGQLLRTNKELLTTNPRVPSAYVPFEACASEHAGVLRARSAREDSEPESSE